LLLRVAETADKYRLRLATAHELDEAIDAWREEGADKDREIERLESRLDVLGEKIADMQGAGLPDLV
jgi:hypothetical protein